MREAGTSRVGESLGLDLRATGITDETAAVLRARCEMRGCAIVAEIPA